MAVYVVGDLQGCLTPLRKLLDHVRFDPRQDKLWLTGDLINRGPQSLETLRFVYQLRESVVTVLGNHDLHLFAVAFAGLPQKKKDTIEPILQANDRDELLHWLRCQPLLHVDASYQAVMAHAGILPGWSIETARELAAEVERVLRSDQFAGFFHHMYGNEPDRWSAQLQGHDRLRFITNVFTRMRIVNEDSNALELRFKEEVSNIPAGYVPWFTRYQLPAGWRLLFGHWAALLAHTGITNIIALDSGAVWGRFLTLLRLDDGAVFTSENL